MSAPLALLLAVVQSAATAVGERVPPDVLRLYLVRHGQALSNIKPTGREPEAALDHLTPLGREQSQEAGRALRGTIALVLSSPKGRARESAEELATTAGTVPLRVEARLRPMALGRSANGQPLTWPQRLAEWTAGRDPTPQDGESCAQVGQRVLDLARELRRQGGGRGIALVAHSEVIGSFLTLLRTAPDQRVLDRIDNGAISLVEVKGDGSAAVVFVNHLPAELAPAGR